MKKTTKEALAIIDSGESIWQAAKDCGLAYSTVYIANKRRKAQVAAGIVRCPCCLQVVREGFEINKEVLK